MALAGLAKPSEITTAAIAKHMKTDPGSVVSALAEDKEAIWQAVMEWVAERLYRKSMITARNQSPLAAMEAMFMSHIEFVADAQACQE